MYVKNTEKMYCTHNCYIPQGAFMFKAQRKFRPHFPHTYRSSTILHYLNSIGFVEIDKPSPSYCRSSIFEKMLQHCDNHGTGCYMLGNFSSYDDASKWIRFCFPSKRVIMFMHVDGSSISGSNSMRTLLCEFSDEVGIEVMSFTSIEKFARFVDGL